jgi:hypothetical protein
MGEGKVSLLLRAGRWRLGRGVGAGEMGATKGEWGERVRVRSSPVRSMTSPDGPTASPPPQFA